MIKNRVEKNSFEDLDMDSTDESLLRASGVTGSMTMFSRVLGLIRDIVIAHRRVRYILSFVFNQICN